MVRVVHALDVDDEHFSEKPAIDELEASDCVGVDLGIPQLHTTSNGVFSWAVRSGSRV